MDLADRKREVDLVSQALELDEETRSNWLEQQCTDNPELLARVNALLAIATDTQVQDALSTGGASAWLNEQPDAIGPYKIIAPIGEGGMGTVYRAERADGSFNRTVAIKFINPAVLNSEMLARFAKERQILADLQHPNIAQLIDGGAEGGRPYIVMELVEGVPLEGTQYTDQQNLTDLFVQACRAVSFAHTRGVIHRDLKPNNILVTANNEAKLLDFGVAKLMDEMAVEDLTATTAFAPMTLAYAAPERLLGEPATTLSDIYSLGVLLYRVMTGNLPYDTTEKNILALYRQIQDNPVRDASTGDADLDQIIAKAMHFDPQRRYASADALADDLERWRDKLPITARADDWLYILRRFVQRNRLSVALGALTVVSFIAAFIITTQSLSESERNRQIAQTQLQTAESAVDILAAAMQSSDPILGTRQEVTVGEALTLVQTNVLEEYADQPETQVYLLLRIAGMFVNRAEEAKALAVANQILDIIETQFGGEHPALATTLASRAIALRTQDVAQAQTELRKALTLFEENAASGEVDWLGYVVAWKIYGATLKDQNKLDESDQAYREGLALLDAGHAKNPKRVAEEYGSLYSNLAVNAQSRQDLESAIEYATKSAAALEDVNQNLYYLTLGNLAGILQQLRRYEESTPMFARAVQGMTEIYGPHHPQTTVARVSSSLNLYQSGDLAAALAQLDPVADHYFADESFTQPLGYHMTKYGYLLCDDNRVTQGLEAAQRGLHIREQLFEATHPFIGDSLRSLAFCYFKQGDIARANEAVDGAIEIMANAVSPEFAESSIGPLRDMINQ